MKKPESLRYDRLIIIVLVSFLLVLFPSITAYAQPREENRVEVSSFEEFTQALDQMKAVGGTIVLTQDITVPAGASYAYNNGRYRKEVVIETGGHTILVEGRLELWPFLTVRGDGARGKLFHIQPGGELRLVSICLDAGENGTAVIQEEGAFLIYASEEGMGLPAFSCTGQIVASQTTTAAAYWYYDCEKLPVVRLPAGADFTADLLPAQVLSNVNRDHQEHEEPVAVIWDETTFPTQQQRTLVRGRFADGYSQYGDAAPLCLVVWESDTDPFFLNAYLQSTGQYDMVFLYGEAPRPGTVSLQSSDDGEIWTELTGTDGYEPIETAGNEAVSWLLSYDQTDPAQKRPKYYRMVQLSEDGAALSSESLQLGDGLIFTAADIEGGRGGETSPNEGEDQISDCVPKPEEGSEVRPPESSSQTPEASSQTRPGTIEMGEDSDSAVSGDEIPVVAQPSESGETAQGQDREEDSEPAEPDDAQSGEERAGNTRAEKIAGTAIVVCILAGSVAFFFALSKKKKY